MFSTHANHKEKLGYDWCSTQSCNAQKISCEKRFFKHNEQYKMQPYVNPN
jgi:hypothetical protein